MSTQALIVGGTRFIGRHTVAEFLDAGYDVTTVNRGNHEDPFAEHDRVDHVTGDRTNEGELREAARTVDPDVVVDCVAYYPRDVHAATEIFADVDAYVYISSGAAYGAERVPKREDATALHDCSAEEAVDDSMASYGPRKAEADRAIFAAADRGVNAMAVRPPVVYGPFDYTERFHFWLDRVETCDRVVVPGDGTNLWHLVYVEDVASALRTVAEEGAAGEAYNVGDDHAPTLGEWVERLADACDTDAEVVTASARELGAVGIDPDDYPIYRDPPHLLSTCKLRSLGWTSTPHEETLPPTVADYRECGRTGRDQGPDRKAEERLLEVLETVE